jgi:hypothetical protein
MTTWNARLISDNAARRRFAAQGMIANFAWLCYFVPIIFTHRWTKSVENGILFS